jgi:NHL repeat
VTIYGVAASGNVAPLHTIVGEGTGLVGPVRNALDASHNVYVTNNASGGPGSVNVYAAGAYGDVAPIRQIAGSSTGLSSPWGIALDSSGNIYVTNTGTNSVTVYAAGADGNVAPIRTISGSSTGLSSPTGIALGANGKIAVSNIGNRSVTEYAANANGNVTPSKTIIGANTGLDFPLAVATGASGNIYVANRDAGPSNIGALTVYPGNANGNVAPLHTIAGSSTGLNQPSGIARTPNATYAANPSATSITVYANGANGNIAPIRTISGANTDLSTPTGVTVR